MKVLKKNPFTTKIPRILGMIKDFVQPLNIHDKGNVLMKIPAGYDSFNVNALKTAKIAMLEAERNKAEAYSFIERQKLRELLK